MEVKFSLSMPHWMQRIIRKYELRQQAISKYCHAVDTGFPLSGVPTERAFSAEGITPAAVEFHRNSQRPSLS